MDQNLGSCPLQIHVNNAEPVETGDGVGLTKGACRHELLWSGQKNLGFYN